MTHLKHTRLLKLLLTIPLIMVILLSCSDDNSSDMTGNSDSFSHTQGVGDSAGDLLAGDSYTELTIEIDYVDGYQPSQTAIDNLRSFLENRLNKPGGVSIILDDEIDSPGIDSVTVNDAYDLEKEHRDIFTSGNTLAAYFLYMDGSYESGNVLGAAYFNTSMVILKETIDSNTGGFGQPATSTVESSVLMHEFGHIMGLVDNGTPAVQDHVDEENGPHCTDDTCLMYWAIETTDLMGNLTGGSIPELDAQCLQDLQANGGK